MGQQRKRNLYSETTDNRTFNIIHIKCVTSCCLRCAIRQRRNFYFIAKTSDKERSRFPSWKLTSKNRKQWMSKNVKHKQMDGRFYSSEIIW
jgi:hypothetical protein